MDQFAVVANLRRKGTPKDQFLAVCLMRLLGITLVHHTSPWKELLSNLFGLELERDGRSLSTEYQDVAHAAGHTFEWKQLYRFAGVRGWFRPWWWMHDWQLISFANRIAFLAENVNLTRCILGDLRVGGKIYTAPHPYFAGVKWINYRYAGMCMARYEKSKDVRDLISGVRGLYDIPVEHQKQLGRLSRIELESVMYYHYGCTQYLAKQFPALFSTKGTGKKRRKIDPMISEAEEVNAIAARLSQTPDTIRSISVVDMMTHLNAINKEAEEMEKIRKKTK